MHRFIASMLFLSLFAFGSGAQAKIFQVRLPTDLQPALDEAASNLEDDTIDIGPGNWKLSEANNGLGFFYAPKETEFYSLTIVGAGAVQTVLDGENLDRILKIDYVNLFGIDSGLNVEVRGITFQNGNSHDLDQGGAGLLVSADQANILIDGCEFLNNQTGVEGGGAALETINGGNITLSNSRFLKNLGGTDGGGANLASFSGNIEVFNGIFSGNQSSKDGGGLNCETGGVSEIAHNTIVGNRADRNGGGLKLNIGSFGGSAVDEIFNNILFGNSSVEPGADIAVKNTDLNLNEVGTLHLFHNDFSELCLGLKFSNCDPETLPADRQGGNIHQDPNLKDATNGDFHLSADSPARDAGTLETPLLPPQDFEGDPRPIGAAPDLGADEFRGCGDGVLDTAAGEACDDGNVADGDGCDSNCQNEIPGPIPGSGGAVGSGGCSISTQSRRSPGDALSLGIALGALAYAACRRKQGSVI